MPATTRDAVQGPFWAAGHARLQRVNLQDRVVWIVLAWRVYAGLLILLFRRPPALSASVERAGVFNGGANG